MVTQPARPTWPATVPAWPALPAKEVPWIYMQPESYITLCKTFISILKKIWTVLRSECSRTKGAKALKISFILQKKWFAKDLGSFPYQSAHGKSMSWACGITAYILTLHHYVKFTWIESPRAKHRVIARCEAYLSVYIAYISVGKPIPWAVAGPHGQLASGLFSSNIESWPLQKCLDYRPRSEGDN